MREVDVRDLACPGPVLRLRDLMQAGEDEVRLWVADEPCRSNVTRFASTVGAQCEVDQLADGTFHVTVRAGERERVDAATVPATAAGPTVVQITASTMGSGNDELGALLMRSFLKTQAELDRPPDRIVFYNGGVMLCCEGSLLLDDLRELEAGGIELLVCGTCLNYLDLADRLAVGRVTDMLEIATTLAGAATTIRP